MSIEFLRESNLEELVALFRRGYHDSGWEHHSFDESYLRENLRQMIGKESDFACMYRKGDRIVGGFVASLGQFLFSRTLVGMENGIYIEPEHRGGRAAFLMYNEFVKWCDKMGAEPFVEIYFSDAESNQRTYNFFTKVGMVECGKIFRSKAHGMPKKSIQ